LCSRDEGERGKKYGKGLSGRSGAKGYRALVSLSDLKKARERAQTPSLSESKTRGRKDHDRSKQKGSPPSNRRMVKYLP